MFVSSKTKIVIANHLHFTDASSYAVPSEDLTFHDQGNPGVGSTVGSSSVLRDTGSTACPPIIGPRGYKDGAFPGVQQKPEKEKQSVESFDQHEPPSVVLCDTVSDLLSTYAYKFPLLPSAEDLIAEIRVKTNVSLGKSVSARTSRYDHEGLLHDYDDDDTCEYQRMSKEAEKVPAPTWPSCVALRTGMGTR